MVAELVAFAVLIFVAAAELIHLRRVRSVAQLAFGPGKQPRIWARFAPAMRTIALGALAWGLVTLILVQPKVHGGQDVDKSKLRHLVLLLDVSPSMRLNDAGPTHKQTRAERVADLLDSFYDRSGLQFKTTVIAFYTGAKPVAEETVDMEIIRNILNELPMHYAFQVGETDLFAGLEQVAEIAKPWNPKSATLVILSDGDSVPGTGMPKLPPSISQTLVIGVGDQRTGKFINGRQSRQDASTLRQVAIRLGGEYHDGNDKQIPTELVRIATADPRKAPFLALTRREYALIACAIGGVTFAVVPVLLGMFGTSWRAGVRHSRSGETRQTSGSKKIDRPAAATVS
jgi:Ca-activated chloride channel family protein